MIKINKKPTPDFLSKWITEYVSKHSLTQSMMI